MTTIAVVRKGGYAAIAADTLTKYGYTKESAEYVANHGKVLKVGRSYIGLSGSLTADLAVRAYFAGAGGGARLESVMDIFAVWNDLHRALKEEFHINAQSADDSSFETSRVSALIANPHGIFGVSNQRAVQEFTKFYSYGSGDDYARGAMYAAYEDGGKTAEEVARLGVRAAAEFDEDTGLPIDSFVVKLRKG